MAGLAELEGSLLDILSHLRLYLPDVVVIGGWVPHLYRRFGGFLTWQAGLSLTAEVDALVVPQMPAGRRPPVAIILGEAGFRPIGGGPIAAVWAREPELGEQIEFLISHSGPFQSLGEIHAVTDQPGLGALALDGLWFLRQHTAVLSVPLIRGNGLTDGLNVLLPRLGAYTINKAASFSRRLRVQGRGNPKRAKDLLYVRDLMAAGDEVVRRITADIADILKSDRKSELHVRGAASNVTSLEGGNWADEMSGAATMLVERDGVTSLEGALADVQGHVTDLRDVLKDCGV
jgi:hypothetical protein